MWVRTIFRRWIARLATRDLRGWSLEQIYRHYGQEILRKAAAEPALSAAIAAEVCEIDRSIRRQGVPARPGVRRAFLLGYAQGVFDSAVIRPDLVAEESKATGYSSAVIRLGALCHAAFAEGLLRMSPLDDDPED